MLYTLFRLRSKVKGFWASVLLIHCVYNSERKKTVMATYSNGPIVSIDSQNK